MNPLTICILLIFILSACGDENPSNPIKDMTSNTDSSSEMDMSKDLDTIDDMDVVDDMPRTTTCVDIDKLPLSTAAETELHIGAVGKDVIVTWSVLDPHDDQTVYHSRWLNEGTSSATPITLPVVQSINLLGWYPIQNQLTVFWSDGNNQIASSIFSPPQSLSSPKVSELGAIIGALSKGSRTWAMFAKPLADSEMLSLNVVDLNAAMQEPITLADVGDIDKDFARTLQVFDWNGEPHLLYEYNEQTRLLKVEEQANLQNGMVLTGIDPKHIAADEHLAGFKPPTSASLDDVGVNVVVSLFDKSTIQSDETQPSKEILVDMVLPGSPITERPLLKGRHLVIHDGRLFVWWTKESVTVLDGQTIQFNVDLYESVFDAQSGAILQSRKNVWSANAMPSPLTKLTVIPHDTHRTIISVFDKVTDAQQNVTQGNTLLLSRHCDNANN